MQSYDPKQGYDRPRYSITSLNKCFSMFLLFLIFSKFPSFMSYTDEKLPRPEFSGLVTAPNSKRLVLIWLTANEKSDNNL